MVECGTYIRRVMDDPVRIPTATTSDFSVTAEWLKTTDMLS